VISPGSWPPTERGSAAVLVTVLAGVLVTVTAAAVVVAGMLVGHRRAAAAADLAAIAGAETLNGPGPSAGPSSVCGRAGVVAQANGARLVSCDLAGRDVLVSAGVDVPGLFGQGWQVVGRARAGPPAGGLSVPGGPGP
jgi:secretion/DNA translocation related TadE-like protein